MDYAIKRLRRHGKKQLIAIITDGDSDFHEGDYVIIKKVKVE